MKTTSPKVNRTSIINPIEELLFWSARKVICYQHPRLTVTATRRHRPDRRSGITEILLTIGKPNHAARKVIKQALKEGKTFPLHPCKLIYWPKRRSRN